MPTTLVQRTAAPLCDALSEAASRFGDAPAIACGQTSWTLRELMSEATAIGGCLEDLTPVRTAVMFVPRNTPASVAFVIAALTTDRVPVLADPAWTPAELQKLAAKLDIGVIICDGAAPEEIGGSRTSYADFEAVTFGVAGPELPASIAFGRFTSGTTGASRCLGFTQAAALEAARAWSRAARYTTDDRILCLATMNNGLAFNACLFASLLSGSQLIFHPGRLLPRSVARTMEASRPTVLVAFPFAYRQLTSSDAAYDGVARLRLAVSSAARLDLDVKSAWSARSAAPICDYYGLAEAGPCTFNGGAAAGSDSLGRPLSNVEIDVVDESGRSLPPGEAGRVRVRSTAMASRFLDDGEPALADEIDADGYYVTRDLGYLNHEGALHLTGRVGRLINIEGRKIDPTEVETVLRALEGVSDAAVTVEPGNRRPRLAAYVESATVDRPDVARHCSERLATYKIPERIEIVDRLPRSSTGKVLRARLQGTPVSSDNQQEMHP